MIKMEIDLPRGMKDYMPEEKILRDEIILKLKGIFELYGYVALDTPIIERYEVLSAKYAGGVEILKETFRLKDQGGRELGLRYDLTVPLARYLAMNPNTKMPFKRYQIGEVFRDGPIKAGRTRQFVQCDADVVGVKSIYADAECIKIALDAFKALKLDVYIEVNSRKLLDAILTKLGVENRIDIILILDKLKKIGVNDIRKELKEVGLKDNVARKLLNMVSANGSNSERIKRLSDVESASEIKELLSIVGNKNIVFNPSLSRGLSYYTGIVFEVFLKDDSVIKSSICGGGRYDKMIGNFIGNKQEYPAVGISFGLEPIMDAMKTKAKLRKTNVAVYIIPINTTKKCIKIADKLRENMVNADVDMNGKGISKNLDYVNRLGIRYALIVGCDELKKKKLKLKDMGSGKERLLSIKSVVKILSKSI